MKKLSLLIALSSVAVAFADQTTTDIWLNNNPHWTDPVSSITNTDWAIRGWADQDGSFTYESTNGTLDIAGEVKVGNPWSSFTNNNLSFNVIGTGDTVKIAVRLDIGDIGGTTSTGNTFSTTVKSNSSESVNTLIVDTITLRAGAGNKGENGSSAEPTAPASTSVSTFNLGGNTVVKGYAERDTANDNPDDASTYNDNRFTSNLYLNDGSNNGGTSKVLITNSNNTLSLETLEINVGGTYANTPKAIFDLGGTGNSVVAKWVNVNTGKKEASSIIKIAAGNTFNVGYDYKTYSRLMVNMQDGLNFKDVYDAKTGELSNGSMFLFEADVKDGNPDVTRINVNSWNNGEINAFIVLDLTDAIDGLEDGDYVSHLFRGLGEECFKLECEYYLKISDTIVGVGETSYNGIRFDGVTFNDGLKFNYYVPEPSTYAAIFGVIALAFVAYRRRK